MPNTYTQIHIHLVFAVKYRQGLIDKSWKDELYKYMTGILTNKKHKLLNINGMPDHIHILFGMRPNEALSDIVRDLKSDSSTWIKTKGFVQGRFQWQEGFGAFAYGRTELDKIHRYIDNQEEHHRTKTFREEYIDFLKAFEIDFEEQYIFKELE
jgi:putative transposase